MSLSSLQLDAFFAVAAARNFSAAARALGLTQSALSQRVMNLEAELGSALFVRESSGLLLTELGERMLRYCRSRKALEEEFLGEVKAPGELVGTLRVGAFSTFTQSILVPMLGAFARNHPGVRVEVSTKEIRELPGLLHSGKVDYCFTSQPIEKQGIENHLLGHEENVLVRANSGRSRADVFLDHDPDDSTTFDFFKVQGKKMPAIQRDYLDDVYAILEGVRAGLGRAVAPRHIVEGMKGVEIVPGFKPLRVPVYLAYYTQPFYSVLHTRAIEIFRKEVPGRLG